MLKHRQGSFQDYYASPEAANQEARTIIGYLQNVRLLHSGPVDKLGPVNKVRYFLFIDTGIPLPTQWGFLNPTIN